MAHVTPLSRMAHRSCRLQDMFKCPVRAAGMVNSHSESSLASSVSHRRAFSALKVKMPSVSISTSHALLERRPRSPIVRISSKLVSKPQRYYLSTPASSPTLASCIPPDSWDSHMHVVGDLKTYRLAADAAYTPNPHLLSDAMSFERSVFIRNIVLVQPSIYGNDNSCLLDALKTLGPAHGRGVVAFDPDIVQQSTLQEWHNVGVRGVRINLKSVGRTVVATELSAELHKYADLIRPFGWVLQLWIGMESMHVLETIVPQLGIKVCVDHMGGPTIPKSFVEGKADPYSIPGFQSLVNLLKGGSTYVKMSAAYRLTNDPVRERDIEPIAKEILRVAGKANVVFATDWPHTRFDGVNIIPFAERCVEWCGNDEVLVERLFRENAQDLWGVKREYGRTS